MQLGAVGVVVPLFAKLVEWTPGAEQKRRQLLRDAAVCLLESLLRAARTSVRGGGGEGGEGGGGGADEAAEGGLPRVRRCKLDPGLKAPGFNISKGST